MKNKNIDSSLMLICSVMFGGGGGCFIFFGINGRFALNLQLTGKMDVASALE